VEDSVEGTGDRHGLAGVMFDESEGWVRDEVGDIAALGPVIRLSTPTMDGLRIARRHKGGSDESGGPDTRNRNLPSDMRPILTALLFIATAALTAGYTGVTVDSAA